MIAFVTACMGVGVLALSWLATRREDARGQRKA